MQIPNSAVLLDTHCWIWAANGDSRMKLLQGYRGRCLVSAISVWEVAMLSEKKRITLLPDVDSWVQRHLKPPVNLKPLTPEISLKSATLPDFHGDPADRILVATSAVTQIPLLTADRKIQTWCQQRESYRDLIIPL
jgi:PIN domain nuclease of toxin-antitoxin system